MSDQILEQKNFSDNKNDNIRILRGKHDKENPYAQISRKMIRDKSISPKAKGVLCYLLSLPDDWNTHPKQLAEDMGVSKDQIYTVLKELLKSGYATKVVSKGEKGRFHSVTYHFFEEKQHPSSEIKIKSTVSGFPDTVFPDTETPPLLNKEYKKERSKEEYTSLKVSSDQEQEAEASMPTKVGEKRKAYAQEVEEIGQEMIEVVKEAKPDYKPPSSMSQIYQSVDLLLRVDKREAAKILRVFRWALADFFWADKFFKPNPAKYLREKFDQLDAKMNAKVAENPNKVDRRLRDKDGNITTDKFKYDLF